MLTERPPTLTENVHLVDLQGHVTGTCWLMIIIKLIPKSVSKRRFAPSLSGHGSLVGVPCELLDSDAACPPLLARRRVLPLMAAHLPRRDRIFVELMTSGRKLRASREGSKGRIYGT